MTGSDDHYMERAFALAEKGLYTTGANPRVGCVLVRDDRIIAEGWTQPEGQAHAEINALENATESVAGATAYVTLEPCSHHGRTPPCTNALINADIGKVVAASIDPNPAVAGSGLEALRQAGIDVSFGVLDERNLSLNCGFFSRMTRSRPWVRVKLAASLDGRTALASGESRWITSDESRADVQLLRARANCILTGVGTILADDPRMTVRLPQERWMIERERQPLLAIVDSNCRTPLGAEIFNRDGKIVIYSKLREKLIDELIVYVAPHLLGSDAKGLVQMSGLNDMAQRPTFRFTDVTQIGPDVRLTLAPEFH